MIQEIINTSCYIKLFVDEDKVEKTKNILQEIISSYCLEEYFFIDWIFSDDGYVLGLKNNFNKYLRIYKNGLGVFIKDEDISNISYFILSKNIISNIIKDIEKQVDYIVNHPVEPTEDDRCFMPICLKYGLKWKYPKVENILSNYFKFEDTIYGESEDEIPLAMYLLEIPEIKELWYDDHKQ